MRVFALYHFTFNDISHINAPSMNDDSVKPTCLCPFPVCWFNISIFPMQTFSLFCWCLDPLLALFRTPVWATYIYCPNSPVCNQHGCLGEHWNNLLLPLKHTLKLKMCTQSHGNPRWVAEMFAMLQSLCPAELTVTDRDKQNTDIHNPDLCQRVHTVKTEGRWNNKSNMYGGYNFSVAWQDPVGWIWQSPGPARWVLRMIRK